jgi:hypothetical protein
VHPPNANASLSGVQKAGRAAADFVAMAGRYMVDSGQRNRMREVLKRDGMTRAQRRIAAAELAAAPAAARAYAGLAATSLSMASIRMDAGIPAHLNLLIGEVVPGAVFAGIHTAITVARSMTATLDVPLRVVMLDFTTMDNTPAVISRYLADEFALSGVEIVRREELCGRQFGSADIWLATHSKTAHAAQVASEAGIIDRARVAYLIQDYEPGFSPWSTESTVAAATYHAGFVPIVNSFPLATFLVAQEGETVPDELVFAPSFDLERLAATAARRSSGGPARVLFYARPSKHRNLFQLGVSALRSTVLALGPEAEGIDFVSAGEHHDDLELGRGLTLRSLGRLGWDDYFELLSHSAVVLSLQASPHPSHPPFDAAISGATAITNDFADTRTHLHPRIVAVAAETTSLADALVAAIRATGDAGGYLPVKPGLLGNPLDEVVRAAVARLRPS